MEKRSLLRVSRSIAFSHDAKGSAVGENGRGALSAARQRSRGAVAPSGVRAHLATASGRGEPQRHQALGLALARPSSNPLAVAVKRVAQQHGNSFLSLDHEQGLVGATLRSLVVSGSLRDVECIGRAGLSLFGCVYRVPRQPISYASRWRCQVLRFAEYKPA